MYSDMKILFLAALVLLTSCSTMKKVQKIRSGELRAEIHVTGDTETEVEDVEVDIDSIRGSLAGEPIIMNAIRDDQTGEMVATDVIAASKVTARFRNVAERSGTVSIEFDVTVPAEMSDSRWQLKLYPEMTVQEDTIPLEPVFITGAAYREEQLKGYGKYDDYVASILTDTADLVHLGQYGIFFQRQNLFDVSQEDALRHYRKRAKVYFNERRKERKDQMFERYVKDPIISEGIRLDTVLTAGDGDFVYRYRHTFRSRPELKKVMVALDGEVYESGRCIQALPFADGLTYYISTLASLADTRKRMLKDTAHVSVPDTVYMAGLEALKCMDYKKAVELLRPYKDYNAALALVSADYNHSALEILNSLENTDAKVCYLKSLVLSRLGVAEEAMKYFELSIAYDPSLEFRANLDPEMSEVVRRKQNLINY